MTLALDQGSCRIYRVADSAYIGICQGCDVKAAEADIILTLVTQDVVAWYERVRAAGWPCEHAPRRNETYDIYHFFLRDPSGYRIEIQTLRQARLGRRLGAQPVVFIPAAMPLMVDSVASRTGRRWGSSRLKLAQLPQQRYLHEVQRIHIGVAALYGCLDRRHIRPAAHRGRSPG